MSYTRLEYFLGILENLGERIDVTATDNAANALEFKSSDGFAVPLGAYDGREVWYVSAAADSQSNLNTTRRITYTNPTTTTITVNAAWPSIPQAGDVIALANVKSMSARVQEIQNKINALIDRVADEMAPPESSTATAFDALSPTIAYPDDWDWVLGAQYQDFPNGQIEGRWRPIYDKDLEFMPWDGVVQVKNKPLRNIGTRNVRLLGATRLQPLTSDDATSVVPKAWLCMQAAAELKREAAIRRGEVSTDLTIANMMLADAQAMRPMVSRQFSIEGGFRWSTHR